MTQSRNGVHCSMSSFATRRSHRQATIRSAGDSGWSAIGLRSNRIFRVAARPSIRTTIISSSVWGARQNLIQAARAHGFRSDVRFDATEGGSVGIALEPARPDTSTLFEAIPVRQCTRALYDGRRVPLQELRALEAAGRGGGVRVVLLTARPQVERVLEYVVNGDTVQLNDPAFMEELRSWIRFSDAEAVAKGDGLFSRASGSPSVPRWLGTAMLKFFFTPKSEGDKYAKFIRSSAGIAVFVSDTSDKKHWVEVGRCYERFALQATAMNIRTAMKINPSKCRRYARISPPHSDSGPAARTWSCASATALRCRDHCDDRSLRSSIDDTATPTVPRADEVYSLVRSFQYVAAAAGGVALVAGAGIGLGTSLWKRTTARAVEALATQEIDGPLPLPFSAEQLATLPDPVARYFRFALTPGQPLIRRARLKQTGTMRSDARRPWSPFSAVEYFSVRPPGFIWDASMPIAPLVCVHVRDSYFRGEGASEAKIAGLISLGALRGTPEAASASLVRYLAEAGVVADGAIAERKSDVGADR